MTQIALRTQFSVVFGFLLAFVTESGRYPLIFYFDTKIPIVRPADTTFSIGNTFVKIFENFNIIVHSECKYSWVRVPGQELIFTSDSTFVLAWN